MAVDGFNTYKKLHSTLNPSMVEASTAFFAFSMICVLNSFLLLQYKRKEWPGD